MKELKLTTWERVQLLRCVPPTARTIEDVGKHLRLADILELTQEEKKLVGWKEARMMAPTGMLGTQTTWSEDMKDHVFKTRLEDADFEHLQALMTQFTEWPVSPLTIVLHDKMEEAKKTKETEKQDEA